MKDDKVKDYQARCESFRRELAKCLNPYRKQVLKEEIARLSRVIRAMSERKAL